MTCGWLVVYVPLWKIWVRQWEGWHPILKWKITQMFQTTNQVVIMTMLTTKQFFNQSKTIKKHVLNHYELILTHEFPMNSPWIPHMSFIINWDELLKPWRPTPRRRHHPPSSAPERSQLFPWRYHSWSCPRLPGTPGVVASFRLVENPWIYIYI